jgi:hypothetical protein
MDKKTLIIAFQALKDTYLHKIDMKKIENNMTQETCIIKVQIGIRNLNT